MAGVGSADNAFAQLNRFEQTVSKEEATAKAFDQLANAGTDNDLEKRSEEHTSELQSLRHLASIRARRSSDLFAQLNRFEQTVSKEEATAKAFDQLANAGTDNDLEKEFAQLGTHGVDSELAALKAERQKANQPPPPYIPKELAGPGGQVTIDVKAGEKAGA